MKTIIVRFASLVIAAVTMAASLTVPAFAAEAAHKRGGTTYCPACHHAMMLVCDDDDVTFACMGCGKRYSVLLDTATLLDLDNLNEVNVGV